ncbi:hypothetical protein MRB53_039263 [Persea americana]|nr:hypothetical protein MRB53_039263 [Persea americana]
MKYAAHESGASRRRKLSCLARNQDAVDSSDITTFASLNTTRLSIRRRASPAATSRVGSPSHNDAASSLIESFACSAKRIYLTTAEHIDPRKWWACALLVISTPHSQQHSVQVPSSLSNTSFQFILEHD